MEEALRVEWLCRSQPVKSAQEIGLFTTGWSEPGVLGRGYRHRHRSGGSRSGGALPIRGSGIFESVAKKFAATNSSESAG